MNSFLTLIHKQLLPNSIVTSMNPKDPVVVGNLPVPWEVLGTGNYAAVFLHPDYPDRVVKIYATGRPGLREEANVYRMLGKHPAYSECLHHDKHFLVLKRLRGTTLYECLHQGIRIPKQVIHDIDNALDYARKQGLHPHDVHGKNVMVKNGRGLVVDVSDFLKDGKCSKWEDLKKAYNLIYLPFFYRYPIPFPYFTLNFIRKSYRIYKNLNNSK